MAEDERTSIRTFSTGCPLIDQTLNGGIRLGQITELYGESGCGKTQFCIQMALEVQRTFRSRNEEASEFDDERGSSSSTKTKFCRSRLHQHGISDREDRQTAAANVLLPGESGQAVQSRRRSMFATEIFRSDFSRRRSTLRKNSRKSKKRASASLLQRHLELTLVDRLPLLLNANRRSG